MAIIWRLNILTMRAKVGFFSGMQNATTGNYLAVAHTLLPFISVYPWSGSGFGTKFSDPATLPTWQGNGVKFA